MSEATTSSEATPGTEPTASTTPQEPAATTTVPAATPPAATSLLSAELPPEPVAGDNPPAAETSAQNGPPEKYELSADDLQPAMLEKFSDLARELKMDNANAQKTLDWYRENVLPDITRNMEAGRKAVIDGWEGEINSDPELGGPKIKQTIAVAQGFIKEYPRAAEFMQMLAETGIGSNPEMVRFMHHWGKGLQEDRQLLGGRAGGGKTLDSAQFQALRPADRAKFMKSGGTVTD